MPGARFFPDARLNFAENLLRFEDEQPALVFRNERDTPRSISYRELRDGRADRRRAASGRRRRGRSGRGFMPNLPETMIAMLATASLGATWSSCSPDFGVHGVVDRFGQIAPKVLFTADGYFYAGKTLDSLSSMAEVLKHLPSVERVVVIPYASCGAGPGAARGGVFQSGAMGCLRRARSAAAVHVRSRSIIRCTFFIRPAPRGCPSASCTAPAVLCSNIRKSTCCTPM